LLNSIEDISAKEIEVPTMVELSQEEQDLAAEEETEVERKREEARRAASERGLVEAQEDSRDDDDAPSNPAADVEFGENPQESPSAPSQQSAPP
jgi:hypothetical protein